MLTASWIAVSASSYRPNSARRPEWLFSERGEAWEERVRAGFGELTVDAHGLLDHGQSLLVQSQDRQAAGLVVQRGGQAWEERVGRASAS